MCDLGNHGIILLFGPHLESLEVSDELAISLESLINPGLRLRDLQGVSHRKIIQSLALFFILLGLAFLMLTAGCLNLKFLFQLLYLF